MNTAIIYEQLSLATSSEISCALFLGSTDGLGLLQLHRIILTFCCSAALSLDLRSSSAFRLAAFLSSAA